MSDPRLTGSTLRGAVDLSSLVRAAQAPASSDGAAPPSGGLVRAVDESTFGDVLELSRTVPVIVEFFADGIPPALESLVTAYGGRLVLATVDGNRSPQLAQAFQVQQVPAVVALVGGRPVPLFVGIPSEPEVRQVFDQVLQLAEQSGVTGTIDVGAPDEPPAEEPLPPLHQAAYDAIEAGNLEAAAEAYRTAITQNPRDQLAVAGLAQVSLLMRLADADAAAVRAAAAANPDDADAQLAVADLDISGGHVDDAFARLLRVFAAAHTDDKATVRARLLDYFEIVGADDPRTMAARRALTALLY